MVRVKKKSHSDNRLFINTLLLVLIFFLLLNTHLTVELKKKLDQQRVFVPFPLVDVAYLTDETCTDCYDVRVHRTILSQLGIQFGREQVIDAASDDGMTLIDLYNISKIPTIILSPEAEDYDAFVSVWGEVGTKEDDGYYIFRAVDKLGDNVTFIHLTK